MVQETEPTTTSLDVVLGENHIKRISEYSQELIQYQHSLNDLFEKALFRTPLRDELREQIAYLYVTEKVFTALANDLRQEDVRIVPLIQSSQTECGIAIQPSSWWTGNIGWQRLETLLKVLYPVGDKYGTEFSSLPAKIREALGEGKDVTLT